MRRWCMTEWQQNSLIQQKMRNIPFECDFAIGGHFNYRLRWAFLCLSHLMMAPNRREIFRKMILPFTQLKCHHLARVNNKTRNEKIVFSSSSSGTISWNPINLYLSRSNVPITLSFYGLRRTFELNSFLNSLAAHCRCPCLQMFIICIDNRHHNAALDLSDEKKHFYLLDFSLFTFVRTYSDTKLIRMRIMNLISCLRYTENKEKKNNKKTQT